MSKKKCLVPFCNNESTTRGLCHSCYMQVRYVVKQNDDVTWEKLEQEGKVLPSKRKRSQKNKIQNWLLNKDE